MNQNHTDSQPKKYLALITLCATLYGCIDTNSSSKSNNGITTPVTPHIQSNINNKPEKSVTLEAANDKALDGTYCSHNEYCVWGSPLGQELLHGRGVD
ncbi:MAG: hypothetical protein K0R14_2082 [Burkholderiales bacterium]|jgi:ABC-type uncharacterized transport system auxiliary subunit|nr:hypothetical protein [Burkholderiales bacterium]